MLYFLVYKNNIAIVQSSSLRFTDLQTYLRWISKKSLVIDSSNTFSFVDTPSIDVVEKFKRSEVKLIKIQAPIDDGFSNDQMMFDDDLGFEREESLPRGFANVILDRIRKKDKTSNIEMASLDPLNLNIDIVLSYKKKTNDSGYEVLRKISSTLSDSGLKFKVHLESGADFNEKDFRIQDKISVTSQNGQLSDSEVHSELKRWLIETMKSTSL
jgi:hypothetical protein